MRINVSCTLYYADWCSHCVSFKSEWKDLKSSINKKNYGIKFLEFDDVELQKVGGGKINNKNIKGYPTIKFTLSDDIKSKDYEYSGDRTSSALQTHIIKFYSKIKN